MLTNLSSSLPSIIFLFAFLVVIFFGTKCDPSSRAISFTITFICFIVLFGLRTEESGVDTRAYYDFFSRFVYNYQVDVDDVGFVFLANIISYFSKDSIYFLFWVTFIQIVVFSFSLLFYGVKNVGLYLIVFILFMPGFDLFSNTIRQGLGLSFFTLSIVLYLREKTLYSFVFLLFASSIHLSFICGSIIYIFHFLKMNRVFYMNIAIFSFVIFLLNEQLDLSIAEFLNSLSLPGILGELAFKLYIYESYDDGRLSGIFKYYFFLIYLIPLMCLFIFKCVDKIFIGQRHVNVLCFYSSILFIYSVISSGTFSFRLLYVIYSIAVLMYYMLYEYAKGYQRIVVLGVIVVSGVFVLDANQMSQYKFSW